MKSIRTIEPQPATDFQPRVSSVSNQTAQNDELALPHHLMNLEESTSSD